METTTAVIRGDLAAAGLDPGDIARVLDAVREPRPGEMLSVHSPGGTYLYCSDSSRALLGREPRELVGQSAYSFFHADDFAEIQRSHLSVLDSSGRAIVRYRMRARDDRYVPFETASFTVRDGERIIAIVAVSRRVDVVDVSD